MSISSEVYPLLIRKNMDELTSVEQQTLKGCASNCAKPVILLHLTLSIEMLQYNLFNKRLTY